MALSALVHHFEIALSDIDRGVYETLDLRIAQHPSESTRFMILRTLAYCLSYEEGIAFSKGGLSSSEQAPVSIADATGLLLAWIDVGAPSAERLHKASKAAARVAVFTHLDAARMRKEAATKNIHKVEAIDMWHFPPAFLEGVERHITRHTKMDLTRNDGHLYVAIDGHTVETPLTRESLVEPT